MTNQRRSISLGFSPQEFPEGQHICYIYNDNEERLAVRAKYLQSGQAAKEKLLYLVDLMDYEARLNTLLAQNTLIQRVDNTTPVSLTDRPLWTFSVCTR